MSSPAPLNPAQSATSKPELREPWTANPSVEEFARDHPERTIKIGFDSLAVLNSYMHLLDALDEGGFPYGHKFPLPLMHDLADQALVFGPKYVAEEMKIVNFDFVYEFVTFEGTDNLVLGATFVFEDAEDAARFRGVMQICDFPVVEDESPPD